MDTFYVYGLEDPRTRRVRYVGATHYMRGRLDCHRNQGTCRVREWLEQLNSPPTIRVLASAETLEDARAREKGAIFRLWSLGEPLLNVRNKKCPWGLPKVRRTREQLDRMGRFYGCIQSGQLRKILRREYGL